MTHVMYDAALTVRMTADAMVASNAQTARMLAGAVALQGAQVRAANARSGRAAAEARLATARAARAAFRSQAS